MKIFTKIYKLYLPVANILSSLRGFTRIKIILRDIALSEHLEKEKDGYVWTYNDTEIKMVEKSQFAELVLHSNTIKGYLQKHDLSNEDLVFDAGAFPGEFTIYAAKNTDQVIALEPDRQNFESLKRNIGLNSIDNVRAINKGIIDKEKTVHFDSKGTATSKIRDQGTVEIDCTTLDKLAQEFGVPDLVKMDIEGAEIKALEGANNLLGRSNFAIASYHKFNNLSTAEIIRDKFAYYEPYSGFSSHKTTYIDGNLEQQDI